MHWIYAHLVGDFLLQTDWMVRNKKVRPAACAAHVTLYMLPFLLTGLSWWKLLLIALEHWIQDRTELVQWFMRIQGSKEFSQPPYAPWSLIVVDNILHILFIALVAWV